MNFLLWIDEAERGPYSLDDIRSALANGTLALNQHARMETGGDWKLISEIIPPAPPKAAHEKKPVQTTPSVAKPAAAPGPANTLAEIDPAKTNVGGVFRGLTALAILAVLLWKLSAIESLLDKAGTPPHYEYMVAAPADYSFTRSMNELGKEGWEIVSARRAVSQNDSPSYEVVLKRQVR